MLRLGPGDLVTAVDPSGRRWQVRLTEVTARAAAGVVVADDGATRESPLDLTLAQGVPKADKMDLVVRVATELGVARVVPVLCERTVIAPARRGLDRPRRAMAAHRRRGGQAVRARASCRTVVARPAPCRPGSRGAGRRGLLVCLWEGRRARSPIRSLRRRSAARPWSWGPRGDWPPPRWRRSPRGRAPCGPGLGPRILRTETAGPVGLALLQARYGDLACRADG